MAVLEQKRLPFATNEFERRLRDVRREVAARRLDAVVLSSPENIYYLTGYHTLGYFAYQVLVVPVDSDPVLVIRYGERSNVAGRSWVEAMEYYRDTEDPVAVTRTVVLKASAKRLGLELQSWFLPAGTFKRLVDAMPDLLVEDVSGLVEKQRAVKSPEELQYVDAAAKVCSIGTRAGLQAIANAKTDLEVAAAIHNAVILAGGEYPPLPPFVSVGPETALFHNTWSGQPIRRGDVVMIEVPGVIRRYLGALARTASLGRPPEYIVDRHKLVRESLEAGISAMRPGVTCADVYRAFAAPCELAGHEVFIKTGYSIGINFPPRWVEWEGLNLLPNNPTVLRTGMVFHTPRTIRVPGDQTPILSETVVITESGHRVLTDAPRELAIL